MGSKRGRVMRKGKGRSMSVMLDPKTLPPYLLLLIWSISIRALHPVLLYLNINYSNSIPNYCALNPLCSYRIPSLCSPKSLTFLGSPIQCLLSPNPPAFPTLGRPLHYPIHPHLLNLFLQTSEPNPIQYTILITTHPKPSHPIPYLSTNNFFFCYSEHS